MINRHFCCQFIDNFEQIILQYYHSTNIKKVMHACHDLSFQNWFIQLSLISQKKKQSSNVDDSANRPRHRIITVIKGHYKHKGRHSIFESRWLPVKSIFYFVHKNYHVTFCTFFLRSSLISGQLKHPHSNLLFGHTNIFTHVWTT